jgi:hypothetical protein
MFSNEKQIRSISNQSKSNKLAKETVRGKRKDKLLLKQKWASHCTMSQKKKKKYMHNNSPPLSRNSHNLFCHRGTSVLHYFANQSAMLWASNQEAF